MRNRQRIRRLNPNTLVLIKQIGIGIFCITLVAGCLTLLWHGVRVERLTLTNITVTGGETIDHATIQRLAESQLEGEYLGFIPRRFAFTYPHEAIVANVASVERVHSIDVTRTDGRTLAVHFSEYRPVALWCQSPDWNDCVFLTETGYAYAPAPDLDGGSFPRFSHTSHEPQVGETLLDQTDFRLLLEYISQFERVGWFVTQVEVDAARDAYFEFVGGGESKVSLTLPLSETMAHFDTIVNSNEFSHLTPGNFSYIDLRFGSKVFVRESLEEESATSTAVEVAPGSDSEEAN